MKDFELTVPDLYFCGEHSRDNGLKDGHNVDQTLISMHVVQKKSPKVTTILSSLYMMYTLQTCYKC